MPTTYFKRLRMEINLRRAKLTEPVLPEGYEWRSWHPVLTEAHARAKWASFQGAVDTQLFPCLSSLPGCRRLIRDISLRRGFVPLATWLIVLPASEFRSITPCATIQGVNQGWWTGAIQNVGVVPEHRGLGLGKALLLQSLAGFRRRGLKRVFLEVTAENTAAIELYARVGFRHTRTSYRSAELPDAALVTM
ncbi:MAG: GNAT family N-acetyltransferase [Planctomycetaceae bacterium]